MPCSRDLFNLVFQNDIICFRPAFLLRLDTDYLAQLLEMADVPMIWQRMTDTGSVFFSPARNAIIVCDGVGPYIDQWNIFARQHKLPGGNEDEAMVVVIMVMTNTTLNLFGSLSTVDLSVVSLDDFELPMIRS